MIKILKIALLCLLPVCSMAQISFPERVRMVLHNAQTDSVRYIANMELGYYYSENNRDSSLAYYKNAFSIAANNKNKLAEASSLSMLGYQNSMKGQYSKSLQFLLDAFTRIEESGKSESMWMFSPGFKSTTDAYRNVVLSRNQGIYSALMRNTENVEQELHYLKASIITAKRINYLWRIAVSDLNLSGAYLKLNKPDSAMVFVTEGLQFIRRTDEKKYESALLIVLGDIYLAKGEKLLARQYYFEGMESARQNNASSHLCWANFALCKYYLDERNKDSSLRYADKTYDLYFSSATPSHIFTLGDVYENLFNSYQLRNQFDSAYKYLGLTRLANDSINKDRIKRLAAFQNLGFAEQMRLRDIEKQKLAYQDKIRTYGLLAGLVIFLLIAFLLFLNNRQKHKARIKIEQAYDKLKATQSQLIQSEKMASLGELTAGIAHEIQNPLNFVNNFSEVNKELVDELQQELKAGMIDDAIEISNDIKTNEQKINHHGKRADAIVKGMLQHSRSSSGIKEPTDINALCDEYLRLSYHGLRAKDKSFNATMKTDFDKSIGNINIVSQDIGRVLFNLINNAFYAVTEKKKSGADGYEPTVTISTRYMHPPSGGRAVEIKVSDNGGGIPESVKDKIFQPFFTTKPTGQGTGLGLSLSYDIVTKGHNGELKVETAGDGTDARERRGEGTTFVIVIPLTT